MCIVLTIQVCCVSLSNRHKLLSYKEEGLWLWCLTLLSTIFQLYHDGQFCWRKPKYQEKTTDLPQVTECFIKIKTQSVKDQQHIPEKCHLFTQPVGRCDRDRI
jgi:hypothetical protein